MLAKVFGTYGSNMDALEPNFELWLLWPSTRQDSCHKQFKSDLRSYCSKFTTLCHFSFVSLSCKYDEDYMKGTFFRHDHRLLDHARLSQIKIVK